MNKPKPSRRALAGNSSHIAVFCETWCMVHGEWEQSSPIGFFPFPFSFRGSLAAVKALQTWKEFSVLEGGL